MFLAFPPILHGTGPERYLVLAAIVLFVLLLFRVVYRFLQQE